MQKITQTILCYVAIILAIVIWWSAAFSNIPKNELCHLPVPSQASGQSFPQIFPYLSSMDRKLIHQALSGDVALMLKLMVEWDVDAEILEGHGIAEAKRLQRAMYLKGQLLGRSLLSDQTPQSDNKKFLPQTYQSASYLMALLDPSQIIGIPRGLRELTDLYPHSLTSRVPRNIDFYEAESLYRTQPSLAIVSDVYTHPSVIVNLQTLGIPLMAHRDVKSLDDIKNVIVEVGQAVNQKEKGEILSIFVEAAMLAIDNRMLAVNHMARSQGNLYSTLYLSDHTHYTIPSKNTLIGQLLDRIGKIFPMINPQKAATFLSRFSMTLDEEQLCALKPECLILSSIHPQSSWDRIERSPLFNQLPARKTGKIYFVNENVQLASDQYIVLAYYDLAIGLVNAHLKPC